MSINLRGQFSSEKGEPKENAHCVYSINPRQEVHSHILKHNPLKEWRCVSYLTYDVKSLQEEKRQVEVISSMMMKTIAQKCTKLRFMVIFYRKERLFGSKGTFGDIHPPVIVSWPKRFSMV